MTDADVLATWKADESLLAQIGARLSEQPTEIEVRIPRGLADAAVEAWQRDGDSDLTGEKCEERIVRSRAAALALIGAALEDRGRVDGDDVIVTIDAWFVGDALNAADDYGLVQP